MAHQFPSSPGSGGDRSRRNPLFGVDTLYALGDDKFALHQARGHNREGRRGRAVELDAALLSLLGIDDEDMVVTLDLSVMRFGEPLTCRRVRHPRAER